MLNQDFNALQTANDTVNVPTPTTASGTTQVAQAIQSNSLVQLTDRFEGLIGAKFLPMDSTTGVSIENGGLTAHINKDVDLGTWMVVEPQSVSSYLKLDLGTQNASDDEKKLQVCCWDGETVTLNEETLAKDEFLELVKSKGFSKASWKRRAVLYAMYLDSEKAPDIQEDNRLLSVYLSPSALKAWEGMLAKSIVMPSNQPHLKLTRVINKTNSGNSYPTAVFERTTHTVLDKEAA